MSRDRPSVLLVDDVEANLVALEAQLERLDCDLIRAGSGNEALRLLLRQDFAAILLDVQMPGMDGYEVARLARTSPRSQHVPIIFITAMNPSDENVFRGYETGAVDVMFKPFNPHVLRSKVQVFLDLHRGRRALADEVAAHKRTLADLEGFNYSVAHDLRTPLRAIEGFSRILMDEHASSLDPDAHGYLDRISAAARRMGALIDDLLGLARIGRASVNPRELDLCALVQPIVSELREAEPSREGRFVAPDGIPCVADAGLMRIALENLLRNAWKFTRKNATASVELGMRDENGETIYFVRDDGAGFDPQYTSRLFQPFQRLHSERDFEGTGIGLAMVRRIIDHHGGRIWAESAPGQGATFAFTLPRGSFRSGRI